MLSESTGYITLVGRNLRLRGRFSTNDKILMVERIKGSLMILHESAVAFSFPIENAVHPHFCEATFTSEYALTAAVGEKYRLNQGGRGQQSLYALTSSKDLAIFSTEMGQRSDATECRLMGRLSLPKEFTGGSDHIAFENVKGSLIF